MRQKEKAGEIEGQTRAALHTLARTHTLTHHVDSLILGVDHRGTRASGASSASSRLGRLHCRLFLGFLASAQCACVRVCVCVCVCVCVFVFYTLCVSNAGLWLQQTCPRTLPVHQRLSQRRCLHALSTWVRGEKLPSRLTQALTHTHNTGGARTRGQWMQRRLARPCPMHKATYSAYSPPAAALIRRSLSRNLRKVASRTLLVAALQLRRTPWHPIAKSTGDCSGLSAGPAAEQSKSGTVPARLGNFCPPKYV
jgi:hypothetical protein